MNLLAASRQWATRPADQRFWNIQELYEATKAHAEAARVGSVAAEDLRVTVADQELALVGRTGTPAVLTHWAFGQLCQRAEAPAQYLRSLPAGLAAENINHGLSQVDQAGGETKVLLHQNGGYFARAILSDKYTRIWNHEIVRRLFDLPEGWRVPPARPALPDQPGARAATAADILDDRTGGGGLSINIGDMIAPAGLYASFEDMFVFMVNEQRRLKDGTADGLSRGFFLTNSEVGKAAFKISTFYYRHVCGNHIVWDASGLREIRIRHIGTADSRSTRELQLELRRYSDASVSDEEAKIASARTFQLAADKDQVIDLVFRRGLLSRRRAEEAFDLAERHNSTDDPKTAWGFAQGVTELSQTLAYADQRAEMDRTAGKIIEMAF